MCWCSLLVRVSIEVSWDVSDSVKDLMLVFSDSVAGVDDDSRSDNRLISLSRDCRASSLRRRWRRCKSNWPRVSIFANSSPKSIPFKSSLHLATKSMLDVVMDVSSWLLACCRDKVLRQM